MSTNTHFKCEDRSEPGDIKPSIVPSHCCLMTTEVIPLTLSQNNAKIFSKFWASTCTSDNGEYDTDHKIVVKHSRYPHEQ